MNNLKEVSIRIEALDHTGNIMPIHRGETGIEPGDALSFTLINGHLSIDLIRHIDEEPIVDEIIVIANHTVRDLALISWDSQYVSQHAIKLTCFPNNIGDHIKMIELPMNSDISLFPRAISGLTLTHPEIAAFRFTRVNPEKTKGK